jgi:hypothetical protein
MRSVAGDSMNVFSAGIISSYNLIVDKLIEVRLKYIFYTGSSKTEHNIGRLSVCVCIISVGVGICTISC